MVIRQEQLDSGKKMPGKMVFDTNNNGFGKGLCRCLFDSYKVSSKVGDLWPESCFFFSAPVVLCCKKMKNQL
jgi:hypothetical protein